MAEEIIDTPVTHEKHVIEENATDAHHRRSSIGGSLHIGSSSRRNSTTKSDCAQNIVPNYLRASTGSCHDFCKYGKKHTFEEKPWKKKPMRKGTATTSPNNNLDFVHIKVAGESKKENIAKTSLEAKTCSPKENASTSDKSRFLKNNSSRVKKTPSPEPPEVIKNVITSPYQKTEVLEKRRSSIGGKVSKIEEKTDHRAEKRSLVKSKLTKVKPSLSSIDSDGKHVKGERNGNVKTEGKIMVPKTSTKKALMPIASSSSPKIRLTRTLSFEGKKPGSLKLASLVKDRNKTRMAGAKMSKIEKVFEKTLHVVKVETGSSSKYSSREKDAEAKENYKKTPRNRVAPSEDKYRSPVKLQFRSGKVVEIRSDNNTPRRLKFRRAGAVGKDSKVELTKKTLNKAGANADVVGAEILSRKVVLKRQTVQGKKEARVLLNNVIEETASKLVESRKSKVKALVGAFETVISLQEVKSSSQTVKLSGE